MTDYEYQQQQNIIFNDNTNMGTYCFQDLWYSYTIEIVLLAKVYEANKKKSFMEQAALRENVMPKKSLLL